MRHISRDLAYIISYWSPGEVVKNLRQTSKVFRHSCNTLLRCHECGVADYVRYLSVDDDWVCLLCGMDKFMKCQYCNEIAVTSSEYCVYYCRNFHTSKVCVLCYKTGDFNTIRSLHIISFQHYDIGLCIVCDKGVDPTKIPYGCEIRWRCEKYDQGYRTND